MQGNSVNRSIPLSRGGGEAMKHIVILCAIFALGTVAGCAPALVGAGATGGYKAATDERGIGQAWDDAAVTTRVKNALGADPLVKARKIDVDTLEGIVILTGVVETEEEAERAVEIAQGIAGVKEVKNNLQLGKKTWGQAFDDKVIGSKVKAKLIKEPGIRSLNIDVDVNKGVVTLTGVVGYQHQKDRVMEIARTTSGVIEVVDNIKVTHP
jgi:hyperosmotically inducible protein